MVDDSRLIDVISHTAEPLSGAADDYNALLEDVGDASLVLIGEASHGTHDFYRERARITRRLIQEKGFNAVAIEGDWPDTYQVNEYVLGRGEALSAVESLEGFKRFPTWMWRNVDVVEFVGWLREFNDSIGELPNERGMIPERIHPVNPVGVYGLDLYSMYASMRAVIRYLNQVDPEAAQQARARYACFEHTGESGQEYGWIASIDRWSSCEDAVVQQLLDLQRRSAQYAGADGTIARERYFDAEQNARLARNAEQYYRMMFSGRVSSWNLRDTHMAETLDGLIAHLHREYGIAKVVVWAHNSHIGDARVTEMGEMGELNLGQLVRQRYPDQTYLIGFSTHTGTVTAASGWDAPAERKRVLPSLPGSYESLFHQTGNPAFYLPIRRNLALRLQLTKAYLQRAIGVVYLPETERQSHYLYADLSQQFDAVLHFDETHAVEPLERWVREVGGDAPETFPSTL
jgi:erythromycin esterase-like protein